MRAVVIGRDGQIARALQEHLSAVGLKVVTLARPEIDLLQPERVGHAVRTIRPDVVINPAAYTAVDQAEDEPDVAYAINAVAAGAVADAAAALGCPLIHISTDYVFDGRTSRPYVETDPVAPLGVYGATKLAGERMVAAAGGRHVILRTAWISSPWGRNFVKTMLRLAAERDALRVVDDQRGAPTFAADIAQAIGIIARRLVEEPSSTSRLGLFHIVNAGETTWCGFARAIMAGARARGARTAQIEAVTTGEYPTRARRPADSRLATARIEQEHGIRLPAWQSSLETCLDTLLGPARR